MMVLAALLAIQAGSPAERELRAQLAPDTSRATQMVRVAQVAFELDRLRLLPVLGGSRERCDEMIGRYCYWYDRADTTLPVEPGPIKRARERLLQDLRIARDQRPESDWLAGLEIRYLVEHGQAEGAVAAARRCGGTPWWCAALAGFALHAADRFRESDSSYAIAIADLPRELFCQWIDWSNLLEGKLRDRFIRRDCDGRARLLDTVLVLSQPLWTKPGNDLRTELLSRRVTSLLMASARGPQTWSRDIDEIGARYGWPVRWSISDPGLYVRSEQATVTGHDRSPAFQFWPIAEDEPGKPAWRWELEPDRPRFRYAPSYAAAFTEPRGFQIARFPRGDSTILVAALEPPDDSAFKAGPVASGAAALGQLGLEPIVARTDSAPTALPHRIAVFGQATAVSIEAWTLAGRRVTRARQALDSLDRTQPLVLSSPLLFRVGETLPESLEDAASRALPSTRLSRSEPVGIYWETGGIDSDSVDVSITVVPVRRGLLGRIGQGLSLVKGRSALTLTWSAPAGKAEAVGRAFELDLRRTEPGKYRLRLEATNRRGDRGVTEVPIELRP